MKKNLGVGVMLSQLRGDTDSVEAFKASIGKQISAIKLEDGALGMTFAGGLSLELYDDGQSCCERRYFHTDDDLEYHVGGVLMDAEVRDAPNLPDEYGDHEVNFLVVTTSKGAFTVCAHNEHNGYYGGFSIRARIKSN